MGQLLGIQVTTFCKTQKYSNIVVAKYRLTLGSYSLIQTHIEKVTAFENSKPWGVKKNAT